MKQLFLIMFIAGSALAVTSSANFNKHQPLFNQHSITDTFPNRTLDTMHRNNWNRNTLHHNMGDTSMMHRDSTRPAPPKF